MRRLLPLIAALALAGCGPSPADAPPTNGLRESGPARYARTHPAYDWARADTAHFRIYVEDGPDANARLRRLGAAAETALADVRAFVGRRSPTGRQSLFFVDSRERMRPLLGSTPGGFAVPHEDVAFFTAPRDGAAPPLRHELAHLEAWETFGERREAWTDEGLATAAVGRCDVYTLADTAAAIVREGRAVPLTTLAADFHRLDDVDAYLQAASVMAFVRERWGLDAVAALWRAGLAGAERATVLAPDALDAAWRAHVQAEDRGVVVEWSQIRERGCESVVGVA